MYIDSILDRESLSLVEASRDGSRHVYFKGISELHNLVNFESIDRFLNVKEGQLHEFVRVHGGSGETVIPSSTRFSTKSQKATISQAYLSGSTVLVSKLEVSEPQIAGICRELEARWGGKSTAKAFATMAGNDGFATHLDVEAALIVQLSGNKRWKLYEQMMRYPLHLMNRDITRDPSLRQVDEITLNPGDVLFIPPGVPHSASCSTEHSLHVTITVSAFTCADLINFLAVAHSQDTEALRAHIYLNDDHLVAFAEKGISRFIEQLSNVDVRKLAATYARAVNAARQDHDDRSLTDISKLNVIDCDTLVFRNKQNLTTCVDGGDKIFLYLSGTISPDKSLIPKPAHLNLPASAAEELHHLINMEGGVLVRDIPGKLDSSSKVLLVRELVKHRILTMSIGRQVN
ncbi:JmjC domain-containing protein [Burkholderia gladioli]|uniref:JmjC domain-containing protein n=1 Tax=Burkholderia gladioli TaxID=28095 RepID=UPI00264A8A13|nr:cupin domain-containing protein [Burkholderia gladioli]MDN7754830.1 cupin domain-containing protein [Burkholderia gladioli]